MSAPDTRRWLEADPRWWDGAVCYQVYPRSFADSDGDGVGDLPGITAHLPHLGRDGLGVDAIWLSPIYPSPQDDFGYDVADYCDVNPEYGTLGDFDSLVAAATDVGVRVVLDFVPNHSSTAHPWFQEALAGRDSPTRDYYIWRNPAPDGGPPNNWSSMFGPGEGGAWRWDDASGQYYLATFLGTQADLNWRNPELEARMHEAMRFWFRRGVAGFRLDVVDRIRKDPAFRDNPWWPGAEAVRQVAPSLAQQHLYDQNFDDLPDALAGLRSVTGEFPGTMLVGEAFPDTAQHRRNYYGPVETPGLQLSFHFELADATWNARAWRQAVAGVEETVPEHARPAWALANHDRSRHSTRHDPDAALPGRTRAAACVLLTLWGTPFLYQGEEIGMRDVPVAPADLRDPVGVTYPGFGRDPERTPMRWRPGPGVGFSAATPWLPDGGDVPGLSVAEQETDPESLLSLYRRLLALRRTLPALHRGNLVLVDGAESILAYVRAGGGELVGVAVNFGPDPAPLPGDLAGGALLCDTRPGAPQEGDPPGELEADSGVVVGL